MTPIVSGLDHFVLTVADLDVTRAFYTDVLGMQARAFTPADGSRRWALFFGTHKINLHQAGAEFDPKAHAPRPGSADLCLLSDQPLSAWQAHLATRDVAVELGPIDRTGARGPIRSLYIRDPDGNLIEIANHVLPGSDGNDRGAAGVGS